MLLKKFLQLMALGVAAFCLAGGSHAANENYPERPIKLVVGYVPGGSPDSIARAVGQKLGEILGQAVVVDNRAGAGGTIATALVAKAPPDGYTLLLGETGQLVIAPWTTKGLSYSVLRDFTPVGMLGTTPLALVTNGKTGIRTVPDLLKQARATPGKLSYGSSGLGSIHHIAIEVLKAETRTDILHVPYKGSGLSLPAVISGEVPVIMTSLTAALPQVQAGTLNLLGVSSAARYPSLPDVPTIGEFVKDYDYASEMGILAPVGTPDAIVAKLSKAMQEALNSPEVRERLKLASIVPAFSTPAGYAENLRTNLRKYERAVKLARIEPGTN
jgi:tripartite-type tricarboxylate transporter receptor subunit TctC